MTEIDSSGTSWTSQFDEPSTMAATAGTGAVPAPNATPQADNISVGQRMISATAGNILTGLLGELELSDKPVVEIVLILRSHPSRCCSRSPAIAVPDAKPFPVYLPYHLVAEKPSPEHWNHCMLP